MIQWKVVQGNIRLIATERYKNICLKSVRLAARASDFEEKYNFIDQV